MDFSPITAYLTDLQARIMPGGTMIAYHRHKEVYRFSCGYSDYDKKKKVDGSERYFIYSCTKPITVAAVMIAREQGKLDLDTPIAEFLPEFSAMQVRVGDTLVPADKPITIRHLMTMTAGFDYNLRNDEAILTARKQHGGHLTTRQFAEAMSHKVLCFQPGDRFLYSLCHDLLGAVLEVAVGMTFGEYLKKYIFDPLGMTETGFDFRPDDDERFAAQYDAESGTLVPIYRKNPSHNFLGHQSGGGGLISTADDYALFADAMACGGVGANGNRIISRESIDMLRAEQLSRVAKDPTFSCATGPGYGYGLGVRTLIDKSQGQRSALGEFGWDGAAGAALVVDPASELSFIIVQHVLNWPTVMPEYYAPIRDMLYDCLGLN